jgi:cytoskeletal protein CcmA (bactofilin family)
MFINKKNTNNMAKTTETDHTSINLVGTGTVIKGEVNSTGDIRIDGTLTGQVKCKGKIVVGNTGVLEGEVFCQNADFSGKIKGKIEVTELLTLKSSARFYGDIITNKLAIEPGASFTGTCSMDKTNSNPDSSPVINKIPEKKMV